MTVAKVTEISSSSPASFEDAIQRGVARASRTLSNITGAWVSELKVDIAQGAITAYRVNMRVTFVLEE